MAAKVSKILQHLSRLVRYWLCSSLAHWQPFLPSSRVPFMDILHAQEHAAAILFLV
jgi:hypothetical protein